jgi:carboxyl-terminal processing protease
MLRKNQHLLTVILAIIISFGCSRRSEGLKQSDIEPLVNFMLTFHVSQNTFDDEISARTLDNLISSLDTWKLYFTKSDYDEFMKDKNLIDDYVRADKYNFLYSIFKRYQTRFTERMTMLKELMTLDYTFTSDESIERDPKNVAYTNDMKEIRDRWRKTLKLQILNYMNSGKTQDEAKKKLLKKYELVEKESLTLKDDKVYEYFMNAFARALDPHSDYMNADEYEDFMISMNLELEGIGAVLRSDDGFVFIESIIPGGPASRLPEANKIQPNDKIISVAQGNAEPEDVTDIPLSAAVKKIRGKKGTTVKLTIVRETEKGKPVQLIVPIIRDKVVLENQAAKSEIYEIKNNNESKKIGYIKLPMFYANDSSSSAARTATTDMLAEIQKMTKTGIDAIVVDLRANPGGSLPEAISTTGLFIKDGPVVLEKSHDKVQVDSDYDSKMYYDGPVVVMIDKLSASASEIFAGALKDYKRALLIGSTSFGKGSVQNLMPVQRLLQTKGNSGAIKVTVQLFYQPSGNSNHLNGVQPDIQIDDFTVLFDGENKLKYPLKWTPIKKSQYEPYGSKYLTPEIVSSLTAKSQARRKNDKEFAKLAENIEKNRKSLASKTISLKKDAGDTFIDEAEKELKKKDKLDNGNKIIDTKNDILLKEVFNITSDYIDMLKK